MLPALWSGFDSNINLRFWETSGGGWAKEAGPRCYGGSTPFAEKLSGEVNIQMTNNSSKRTSDWKVSVMSCNTGPVTAAPYYSQESISREIWDEPCARRAPHSHARTRTHTPRTRSQTSLSGCRDPQMQANSFGQPAKTILQSMAFVLLVSENKCAGWMREKNMGDVATLNHENTILSLWKRVTHHSLWKRQ